MTVRLRYKMEVSVSSTSAEDKDLGNVKVDVCADDTSEGGCWKTTVAAAATETLDLDNIASATFLALRIAPKDPTQTMTAVTVTINGGAAFALLPVGAAKEAHLMLSSTGITSVTVANTQPSAVALDVTVSVAGD